MFIHVFIIQVLHRKVIKCNHYSLSVLIMWFLKMVMHLVLQQFFPVICQRFVLRVVALRFLLHRRIWTMGGTPASRKAFSPSLVLRIV